MEDYYKVLGVARDADLHAIKRAYRVLALQWHPDKNLDKQEEANERFKEITNAFKVLSDATKRAKYDKSQKKYRTHQTHQKNPVSNSFEFRNPKDVFSDFFDESHFPRSSSGTNYYFQCKCKCFPFNVKGRYFSKTATYLDRKKIVVERIVENGQDTVKTYENDVLISKIINGKQQLEDN